METNFSPRQIRDFVKAVRKEVGDGWNWLTPRIQEALIAERALMVIGSQHCEKVRTDAIHELFSAMLVEAGLREAGE